MMTIVGVDPGITVTGWAVVAGEREPYRLVGGGCIRPRREGPVGERLHDIFCGIAGLCGDFAPRGIALEGSFYGKNVKAALTIGQARAAVFLAAAEAGVPVFEYPARVVKQAITGHGQAAKSQVGYMVQNLLGLREPLKLEDTADAAAIALCHLLRQGSAVQTLERTR